MRAKCDNDVEFIKKQCGIELDSQKQKYEMYLEEIKHWHQQERLVLEEKLNKLKAENHDLKEKDGTSSAHSFYSDFNRENGIVHLASQLAAATEELANLKVKSAKDLTSWTDKNKDLKNALKEAKDFGEKMGKKFDELAANSKSEIMRLKAKIQVLEKRKNVESSYKEIDELRRQVRLLKNDMVNSEAKEKKLVEAINKKKESQKEMAEEKEKMKDKTKLKKILDVNTKLEKDIKELIKEISELKDENKQLRLIKATDLINREVKVANSASNSKARKSVTGTLNASNQSNSFTKNEPCKTSSKCKKDSLFKNKSH